MLYWVSLQFFMPYCFSFLVLGQMQWTAQQSGDLWENSGGPGAWSHQVDELHVLPGIVYISSDMVRESLTVLSLAKLYKPNLVSTPAHSNRPFLWGGPSSVPHWAQEGLCVRGLPDDPRKVHQHVRCAGWTEEHEVQCEERPLCLQTVHRVKERHSKLYFLYSHIRH